MRRVRSTGRSWLLAMALLSLLAMPVAARPKPKGNAPGPQDALVAATREWKALSADPVRKSQPKAWRKVVDALESAGRKSGGPTAALALMRAGKASEELARLSSSRKDLLRAERLYLDSAASAGTGSLADDALLAAAVLEHDRLGEAAKARKSAEKASALKGDRRPEAQRLLVAWSAKAAPAPAPVPAPPAPAPTPTEAVSTAAAEQALLDGTKELRQLQALPAGKVKRDAWLKLAARLESAGDALAPTRAGALAYLRAAKARETVASASQAVADARAAVSTYLKVAERCPGGALADDALVAAAGLESRVLSDPTMARRHLEQAVALGGDVTQQAREMLHVLDDAAARSMLASRPTAAPDPEGVKDLQRKVLSDTEWSLAEQVGLKVRRIVVDAGHGGHDTGAIGPTGVKEKDVTLAVARELATQLRARGFEVVLTRDADVYLALEERTELANREKGDLFVSVHANAHKSPQQSGVETYSLNVASDRYSMRLAARENASTERPGSDLQFLLADLATRANTVDSDRLAREVQASVVRGVSKKFGKPKDHGVKHALFYVLLGAKMPAVLVETAFLSNPAEEKKLASRGYQSALGRAISDGVDRFVARRQQLASIGK